MGIVQKRQLNLLPACNPVDKKYNFLKLSNISLRPSCKEVCFSLDMVDINVVREECFVDEILTELPSKVAKPTPGVKGKNLKKFFNQFSDSLKDIQLQYTSIDVSSIALAFGTNVGNAYIYQRNQRKTLKISSEVVISK